MFQKKEISKEKEILHRKLKKGQDINKNEGAFQSMEEQAKMNSYVEQNVPMIQMKQEEDSKILDQTVNTSADFVEDAINASNAISNDLNNTWDHSKNNTTEAREYSGAVVNREDGKGDESTKALNIKKGKKGHSKPKTKGGEIDENTDQLAGEFHTHPYRPTDIEKVSGAYNWDGTGTGPSGGDLTSLASYTDLTNGYFMIIESGTARYLIVITDEKNYKTLMEDPNTEDWIDEKIGEEILNKDNMPKNPEAKHPMAYQDVQEKGTVNALNQLKNEKGLTDPGFEIWKATDKEKKKFEKIF